MSMGQVTVRVIRFSPVSIIPPTLHTHLHVQGSVTGRTSGRRLGTLNTFYEIGKRCVGKCCNYVVVCKGDDIFELFHATCVFVCVCVCVCVYI